MPELPEVETVVRGLAPDLTGARIRETHIYWPGVVGGVLPETVNQVLRGQLFKRLHRRGKYICMTLSNRYLVAHLRMTGRLYLSQNPEGDDKWVRLSLALEDGRYLVFSDARKFGRVVLASSLAFLEEKLGPEPLDTQPSAIKKIFTGSQRAVKVFLLDQTKIAGIGNIYADESLYRAGIHPQRPVSSLKPREKQKLAEAIQWVLRQAIQHEGATIGWYRKPDGGRGESQDHFQVYGREEAPCLRCGTPISKMVLGQRGTHFCGRCQRAR